MRKCLYIEIILVLGSGLCFGQSGIRNSGNLQLHAGANMTVVGNVENSSAANLINNGSLYLKGNLTNHQALMSAGIGTLYLNGTSNQTIAGTELYKTSGLVTDNIAGIVLNNNLTVSGTHTFTNGIITTSATPNYFIYDAGSTHNSSADTRHISGWVKKIGTSDFVFPVGNGTYLRPVAMSNLSGSAEFNCHYYNTTNNIYELWSPLVQVKPNEYWQVDKISGGTAQITLNWDNTKVPMDNIDLADILSAEYNGNDWESKGGSATGDVSTTGSITSNNINTFGEMTLGYKSFPVPLKLISFSGLRRNGTSYLDWTTDNEFNVSHFEVQRSYDASSFTTIGNRTARNSGNRELYSFEDPVFFRGIVYYRLRSVDNDGTFSYSKIIALSEKDIISSDFVVFNPVRYAITIFNKTTEQGVFGYRLINSGGQVILQGNVNFELNGNAVIQLPSQTASGTYVLELRNSNILFTRQVLVER